MSKNFDVFLQLLSHDKIEEIVSKYSNDEGNVNSDLATTIAINIDFLKLYHNWLTSED